MFGNRQAASILKPRIQKMFREAKMNCKKNVTQRLQICGADADEGGCLALIFCTWDNFPATSAEGILGKGIFIHDFSAD